ncbi:hypothetical protein AGR5A_Cc190143 [Agrobacterium genomosp. 5 str. CFBP 6626]|nr:hypothetical protein AGR5A_Cc190143 [Agrobacterium genomosp. 5 str. CFBP 6626]
MRSNPANEQATYPLQRVSERDTKRDSSNPDHAQCADAHKTPTSDIVRDWLHFGHILVHRGYRAFDACNPVYRLIQPSVNSCPAFCGFVFRPLERGLHLAHIVLYAAKASNKLSKLPMNRSVYFRCHRLPLRCE